MSADGGGNAELAGIISQAGAIDGQVAAQGPEAVAAAQELEVLGTLAQENVQGVAMILDMSKPILGMFYPSIPGVLTDEACAELAEAYGPLLAKYGISLKEFGGRWELEIKAAFVTWPIARALLEAIKGDISAKTGKPVEVKVVDKPATITAQESVAQHEKMVGLVEGVAAGMPAVDSMTEFPGA